MGGWSYKNIGVEARPEHKKHVEKIFEYIGYTTEPADTGEGYAECTFWNPSVYGCVESIYNEQSGHVKAGFKSFGAKDLLYLVNALFPKTSVYVHSTEGNTVSDTWESHNRIYDANTMTLECKDSYTDYGGDGPNGYRSWKERFTLRAPKQEYVQALIELSSADDNGELTASLLELSRKLTEGLVCFEDDDSDTRVIGEEYEVEEEGDVVDCDEEDDENNDDDEDDGGETNSERNSISNADDFVIRGTILKKYTGNDEHVVIPDGVTEIGEKAFRDNYDIQSLVIPEGVTFIDSNAFDGCENLRCITLPTTLKFVELDAFGTFNDVEEVRFNGTLEQWHEFDKNAKVPLFSIFYHNAERWYIDGQIVDDIWSHIMDD